MRPGFGNDLPATLCPALHRNLLWDPELSGVAPLLAERVAKTGLTGAPQHGILSRNFLG